MAVEPYVCAVTGKAAPPAEDVDPDLGDLPVGWTRVTRETRRDNPKWHMIHGLRAALVNRELQNVPEEKREEARPTADLVAEATFAALLAQTPRYLTDETEDYVSPDGLPSLREVLGEEGT